MIIGFVVVGFLIFLGHVVVYKLLMQKKPKDIRGRHVVITGGSQGIGLGVAISCAKRGSHVTILARKIDQLQTAISEIEQHRTHPDQKINYRSLDVCTDYETIEKTFQEIETASGPTYMLVNCAGTAICGVFEDISVKDAQKMMNLNYFGAYMCTKCVLPKMKVAKDGIIVFCSSVSALIGVYGYSAYSATKFALRGLAESIAMEVKKDGVTVTLAVPGDTDTTGFEIENLSKPEETKLISAAGGLAKPEDVGERIVRDALLDSFFSVYGFEPYIFTLACVGMAPWTGPFLSIFQVLFMGIFRVFGILTQWYCQFLIQKVQKQREKTK